MSRTRRSRSSSSPDVVRLRCARALPGARRTASCLHRRVEAQAADRAWRSVPSDTPASSASAARLRARARPAMAVRSITAGAGRMTFCRAQRRDRRRQRWAGRDRCSRRPAPRLRSSTAGRRALARPQAERRGQDARVVGHGLRSARRTPRTPRPESPDAPPARSTSASTGSSMCASADAGMAQQRELHGKAEPIGIAAARGHKVPIGRGTGCSAAPARRDRSACRTAAGAPRRSAVVGAPQASPRPKTVHRDCGRRAFTGRILWTEARRFGRVRRRRPENGRLGDGDGRHSGLRAGVHGRSGRRRPDACG